MASKDPENLLLELEEEEESDPVLTWELIFGNANPVELEIGIGKGRLILDAAQRQPQINFVGVEWAAKYLRIAHERGCRRGLGNIRFVHADAREFIEFFVPAASLQAIHLYFPDPWPKKRHHKRRLFTSEFLAQVERTLKPAGKLWLATDCAAYFATIHEVLDCSSWMAPVNAEWPQVKTNYEDKFIEQGKVIFREVLAKRLE